MDERQPHFASSDVRNQSGVLGPEHRMGFHKEKEQLSLWKTKKEQKKIHRMVPREGHRFKTLWVLAQGEAKTTILSAQGWVCAWCSEKSAARRHDKCGAALGECFAHVKGALHPCRRNAGVFGLTKTPLIASHWMPSPSTCSQAALSSISSALPAEPWAR